MPQGPPVVVELGEQAFDGLVRLAGRAPSLHNSQPWRFRFRGGQIELIADPRRALLISDPRARELVISCGAALHNMCLGLRALAIEPLVTLIPDLDQPLILARVDLYPGEPTTPLESKALSVVHRRHTHRNGFESPLLPGPLSDQLEADVSREGCQLVWFDDAAGLASLEELIRRADQLQMTAGDWRAELETWTVGDNSRRDGVPTRASNPRPRPAPDHVSVPGRMAVLLTPSDWVEDWLCAGRALQRMLLTAAGAWTFARYATAVLEVPQLRLQVRDLCPGGAFPQMLFDLGVARSTITTPRIDPQSQIDDGSAGLV